MAKPAIDWVKVADIVTAALDAERTRGGTQATFGRAHGLEQGQVSKLKNRRFSTLTPEVERALLNIIGAPIPSLVHVATPPARELPPDGLTHSAPQEVHDFMASVRSERRDDVLLWWGRLPKMAKISDDKAWERFLGLLGMAWRDIGGDDPEAPATPPASARGPRRPGGVAKRRVGGPPTPQK